jgi:tetratricopeptide (TPR) repeat protein
VGRLEEVLGLDQSELELLSRMNGQVTLDELESDPRWVGLPSGALIVALHQMGVLDFDPGAKHAAPRAPSPALQQQPPPAPPLVASRPSPAPPERSRAQPDPIGAIVASSQRGQSNSDFSAEVCFNRGLQLLERSEAKAAFDQFANAVEQSPAKLEYQLYRAYADFLGRPDQENATNELQETRQLAVRAFKQDGSLSKAQTILGRLARVESDAEAAIEHFKLALEINPNDREAERELRLLEKGAGVSKQDKQDKLKKFLFRWDK